MIQELNLDELLLVKVALQVPQLPNWNQYAGTKGHDTEPCHPCIGYFTYFPHLCFSVFDIQEERKLILDFFSTATLLRIKHFLRTRRLFRLKRLPYQPQSLTKWLVCVFFLGSKKDLTYPVIINKCINKKSEKFVDYIQRNSSD